MGRYDLRPLRVRDVAAMFTQHKWETKLGRPPWLNAMSEAPPTQTLVRMPAIQHRAPIRSKRIRKASRMFQPQLIHYAEDDLRQTFFKDHPWELARPRIMVEDDGNDHKKYDWSRPLNKPDGRPLNGESVVQRQMWLVQNNQETVARANAENRRRTLDAKHAQSGEELELVSVPPILTTAKAYDIARKEFYAQRHYDEMEKIVHAEEAKSTGAYFGPSANTIGMHLEGEQFDRWRTWAVAETTAQEQARAGLNVGGMFADDDAVGVDGTSPPGSLEAAIDGLGEEPAPEA